MTIMTEKLQSLWSYGILYRYTNVQILPVVTICQLKADLMVLFASEKMVKGTGIRVLTNVSARMEAVYCIASFHIALPLNHLSDATPANIHIYLPLEFLKCYYSLLPPLS